MRTIAIDLDDTLNDFTETLRRGDIVRAPDDPLSEAVFRDYLDRLRRGWAENGGLLSTEFTYFRYRVHRQCYEKARARPDGVAFMQRLRRDGWRIVVCTYRDLRRTQDCTREWLSDNAIPFDHLFMAGNKIAFCKLWGIGHLIDDDPFNAEHGERHGVRVYRPAPAGREPAAPPDPSSPAARTFATFDDILPWIQG
jgi:hypothetical protein